jgi:hypothetical protein
MIEPGLVTELRWRSRRKKRGVACTYEGKRAGRPLLASWARTGLVLAFQEVSRVAARAVVA